MKLINFKLFKLAARKVLINNLNSNQNTPCVDVPPLVLDIGAAAIIIFWEILLYPHPPVDPELYNTSTKIIRTRTYLLFLEFPDQDLQKALE